MNKTLKQRLEDSIYYGLDGCWYWLKCLNACGYGLMGTGTSKYTLAHRVSYKIYKGCFDEKMCICHTCDNPACVNPDHLWLGTHGDNMVDKSRKGRVKAMNGFDNPRVKLTINAINEIKNAPRYGSSKRLTEKYNVSLSTYFNIRKGSHWSNKIKNI